MWLSSRSVAVQEEAAYVGGLGSPILTDGRFLDAVDEVLAVAGSHRLFHRREDGFFEDSAMDTKCEGQDILEYKALMLRHCQYQSGYRRF